MFRLNELLVDYYFDLLIENRELVLVPSTTMVPELFSIPQFVLSFSLAYQEFENDWQRYLLILSYFITYKSSQDRK
jgi:hypothetical protein